MISGLSTLKTWGLVALGFIASAATIFGMHQRNKRVEDEHEDVKNTQRVERQDAKITADGLVDESRVDDEIKDQSITDYFRKT